MTTAGAPAAAASEGSEGSEPIKVTTLELFFDLIFAFTLTQLAGVLERATTAQSVLRVLLIFGLLWWMYGGYAWLTNTRSPVRTPERLLLVLGMAGFLITGLAIPAGFGRDGLVLGLGYLLVVVVHAVLYLRVNRNILRVVPFNLASALLVIIASFTTGAAAYGLWAAALLIQAGSPLVVRVGGRFEIRPAHFAERHGALIIVAIGESVAAIGIGAGLARQGLDAQLLIAAVLGLALSVTLWWLYFGTGDDERGERAMRAAARDRRAPLALSAYFYAHMAMLLGIVFAAAGVAAVVSHGQNAAAPAALALGSGAAAFIAGTAGFRAALGTGPLPLRLAAAAFALATVPLGALVAIEAQLALITAGIAALLIAEGTLARRTAGPWPDSLNDGEPPPGRGLAACGRPAPAARHSLRDNDQRDRALHVARDGPGLERGAQVRALVPGRNRRSGGQRRGRDRPGQQRRPGQGGSAARARGGRRDRGGDEPRRDRVPVGLGRQHQPARGRRLRALRHDLL